MFYVIVSNYLFCFFLQHNYVICMIKKKSGKQKGNGMDDTSTTSNLKQEDVQLVQQILSKSTFETENILYVFSFFNMSSSVIFFHIILIMN